MELQFKETRVRACQDLARLTRSVQLAMESVVPDTRDDIGRILSVRPEIYLKNKESKNKAVSFAGDAVVTVLYVNEEESAVSSFRITQSFNQEYELPSAVEDDRLLLHFSAVAWQAKVLNPRKLSVDLEISADLIVSRSTEVVIDQEAPEPLPAPIHLQQTEASVVLTTGISEKSFSINDQLPFPEDAAQPREIIGKEIQYLIRDREAVGNRLLIKGDVAMTLFYYQQDSELPSSCRFSVPYSLLIDLEDDHAQSAEVWIVPTSDYISLTDSIDGTQLLDLELHALAQARTRRTEKCRLVTDAYSNQLPCECVFTEQTMPESSREQRLLLGCEERIDLPDEFQELISFYPELGSCTAEKGSAAVGLLCRTRDGKLFPMHRTFVLTANGDTADLTSPSIYLTDFQVRADDHQLVVLIRAEGLGLMQRQLVLRRAASLNLDEEQPFDSISCPSLTAVWAKTESVWEMAKLYHSSPEAICALNQDLDHRPIFVPKTK